MVQNYPAVLAGRSSDRSRPGEGTAAAEERRRSPADTVAAVAAGRIGLAAVGPGCSLAEVDSRLAGEGSLGCSSDVAGCSPVGRTGRMGRTWWGFGWRGGEVGLVGFKDGLGGEAGLRLRVCELMLI